MTSTPRELYLVPHAHTDIGYSHDPVVAWELHCRFLDRAVERCEQTRDRPEGCRFRWTIEVLAPALRWWEQRDDHWHARLVECLRRGEIDAGARYLNGTELYAPGDLAWEVGQLQQWTRWTGHRPRVAVQNDVNGFPLPLAQALAEAGVQALVMGLNTTMGHSPFPRCHAVRWDVGAGPPLLAWNGWIYNRFKLFGHLDRLAADLPGREQDFFASLPPDYPHRVAMTSATMGDNAGPFVALPEQVERYNAQGGGLRLRLATFREFIDAIAADPPPPVHRGAWPDFWTFGLGALPQMVASVRRAQRRLALVEGIRACGWANPSGGGLTLDRARRALAHACEHTYDSHTSSGEECGSSDSLRQKAQVQAEAALAESASMVLLRDHLAALAQRAPGEPVSVLVANPHPFPATVDYPSQAAGLLHFARSRQPEHLFQFDREPTFEALAQAGDFGALDIHVPAAQWSLTPLHALPPGWRSDRDLGAADAPQVHCSGQSLRWDRARLGLTSWAVEGVEWLDPAAEFAGFTPVLETPLTPFQVGGSGTADMDPADCGWNPALAFERRPLPCAPAAAREQATPCHRRIELDFTGAALRRLAFTLDHRHPHRLGVDSRWRWDADPALRAIYLTLPLALPEPHEPCAYWVDGCGQWFEAERGQLPNTCNSFYQCYRGVAVERGGRCVYVIAPDTTLVQLGGFTFGQSPQTPLQRQRPAVLLWVYNNYWSTNFPSYSPGHAQARFLVEARPGPFDPQVAAQLHAAFDTDYLTHPVA